MPMEVREVIEDKRRCIYAYGTWGEYLEQAQLDHSENWRTIQSRKTDASWSGTKDFEEAIDLAANGWPEGRKKFAEIAAEAVDHLKSERPGIGFDVAGLYPHIPRYLGGEPESMVAHTPMYDHKQKVVPIYVGTFYSCANQRHVFYNRGGAIAGLIDRIEDSGHSVELHTVCHSKTGDLINWTEVVVKAAGEPLDLDRLAFATTHPAMFRRVQFAVHESLGDLFNGDAAWFENGYGYPARGWPDFIPGSENYAQSLFFEQVAIENEKFQTLEKATENVLQQWEGSLQRIDEDREAA